MPEPPPTPLGPLPELVDKAPCGFLSFTDDGRIVVVNDTLLRLLGYERRALLGQHVETLMPLPTRIFYQTHFFPLVRLHGRADEIYLTLRSASGTDLAVFVNAARRDEAGGPVNHCVLFPIERRRQYEDELLKARREAEAALARNEALTRELGEALQNLQNAQARLVHEEKLAGLGRMASGIAHEVRNPLNFVVNFAQLAQDQLADLHGHLTTGSTDAPEHRETTYALLGDLTRNAGRIVRHGRRVDTIIRRMTVHVPDVPVRRIALNTLVEEHVSYVVENRDGLLSPASTVERHYDPSAGDVDGDPDELGRAIEALVGNALDAVAARALWTPPGSKGAPRTMPAYVPVISVCTRRSAASVEIEVTDNGAGISDAVRARIFEPFFTTKGPSNDHAGLGLSAAYEVVRRHGGSLEVSGSAGEGATFTVTLPVPTPAA